MSISIRVFGRAQSYSYYSYSMFLYVEYLYSFYIRFLMTL